MVKLPEWAEPHPTEPNTVLVDPDKAYPALLKELGKPDQKDWTQYWLEVAYQCMKMDLQFAMRKFGFNIHIRSDGDRKMRWNLTMWPDPEAKKDAAGNVIKETTGSYRATYGKEAREHYRRMRGFIPGAR